jgi:hypothetical protein
VTFIEAIVAQIQFIQTAFVSDGIFRHANNVIG